jgi:SNF2 family DNA or RNA helicase
MNESNLHPYQHRSVNHIIDNTHSGLFLDMGLGKTVSALTAVNILMFQEFEITKVLVIAPKRVAEHVWTDEVEKWEHLQHLKVSIIAGNEKQRKKALSADADIYTLGRDNVAWLCGLYGGNMLPFDMLIIDESSSFKNPKSLRFKALRAVQPSFERIVLLTGTPAPNSLIDLWSQIYLLDRGERLGKFLTHYREEYFRPNQRNGAVIFNYKLKDQANEKRIHDKIGDICISMKAKDYLDLPGRINNYIKIKFPEELQKKYDDFEKEQILDLYGDGEEITALNAAALSNKLLQFANGAVYDENKDWHEVHRLKLEACKELIEDAGGKPVLIAWTYRHDMYRLKEYLKKHKPRELKTGQDIKDWNTGKIQVMLMHPASGGHGLNLQSGGNIIIWFGQTWSLELYQQLNARLDRQGQKEITVINHLISVKTIDQDVVKALERKGRTQEGLMSAIKAKIDKYVKKC